MKSCQDFGEKDSRLSGAIAAGAVDARSRVVQPCFQTVRTLQGPRNKQTIPTSIARQELESIMNEIAKI